MRVIKIALARTRDARSRWSTPIAARSTANPAIKMVLLTHLSHRTGLVLPIAEIVGVARERGIDALVDAAHSVGQLDFRLPDLDADFVGINLHKWIGAPLGVGAVYIRRERIAAIDPDPAENPTSTDIRDARSYRHARLCRAADRSHRAGLSGGDRRRSREARLRALRDRWVRPLRDLPQVQILTPDDPKLYGAITSFRLRGPDLARRQCRAGQGAARQAPDLHRPSRRACAPDRACASPRRWRPA